MLSAVEFKSFRRKRRSVQEHGKTFSNDCRGWEGPITWGGLAQLARLARFAGMIVQPGITRGEPVCLRLNLEAVVWKDGYLKENESSDFSFANPLF